MKYGLLDCGDLRSNRGTSIYQTAPKTRLGFWFRSQSIPIIYQRRVSIDQERGMHTLFAGFAFNFSKIFCDWVFVAELMLQRRNGKSRSSPYERKPITPKSSNKLLSWKRQIRLRNCRIVQSSNYFRADDYIIKALPWTRPMLQATASYDECQTCASKFPTAILQRRSLLEIRYQRTFTTQVRILCDAKSSWE